MAGKYSYSLISILFLAHSAKLENLSEAWSCLNSVNGCKFSVMWLFNVYMVVPSMFIAATPVGAVSKTVGFSGFIEA